MSTNTGWIEKELLDTFYHIVEEFRLGMTDESAFFEKIFAIADRYGRLAGKEEANRNQMSLFAS
jgi:hypothetical protein